MAHLINIHDTTIMHSRQFRIDADKLIGKVSGKLHTYHRDSMVHYIMNGNHIICRFDWDHVIVGKAMYERLHKFAEKHGAISEPIIYESI